MFLGSIPFYEQYSQFHIVLCIWSSMYSKTLKWLINYVQLTCLFHWIGFWLPFFCQPPEWQQTFLKPMCCITDMLYTQGLHLQWKTGCTAAIQEDSYTAVNGLSLVCSIEKWATFWNEFPFVVDEHYTICWELISLPPFPPNPLENPCMK